MPLTVTDPLYQSILAEKSRRWDDMVVCADKLAAKGELNFQERGIFSEAYRQYIGTYRTAWRLLGQIQQRKQHVHHADKEIGQYRLVMAKKVSDRAHDGLEILGRLAFDQNQPDQVCWMAKQRADLLRYTAEVNRAKLGDAEKAYEAAAAAAQKLPPGDTLRMMTLLNQAVFVNDLKLDTSQAIQMLTSALDETPEPLGDEEKVVRALMVQNLRNWQSAGGIQQAFQAF